jgi:DNA-binding GntR family transcriptional regulator
VVSKPAIKLLKSHLSKEKAAIKGDDVGLRSFLLGDFHVCLAECLGNTLLADTLRDFTARTTLIAMLYQSSHDAAHSCAEHAEIVAALEKGEWAKAEQIMQRHIGNVQDALKLQPSGDDPLAELRKALKPLKESAAGGLPESVAQPLHTRLPSKPSDDSSTYLKALL